MEVEGAEQAEIDALFDLDHFRFHGPDGFESDYAGLTGYFVAIGDAFEDRSIRCDLIIVDGNHVACQTWMEGRFVKDFTM